VACGKIWRIEKRQHRGLIAIFLALMIAGGIWPYFYEPTRKADVWVAVWFPFCVAVLWPLVFYVIWKCKLRR
jgi:hypothetical protein